jgi:hypothetical protein
LPHEPERNPSEYGQITDGARADAIDAASPLGWISIQLFL